MSVLAASKVASTARSCDSGSWKLSSRVFCASRRCEALSVSSFRPPETSLEMYSVRRRNATPGCDLLPVDWGSFRRTKSRGSSSGRFSRGSRPDSSSCSNTPRISVRSRGIPRSLSTLICGLSRRCMSDRMLIPRDVSFSGGTGMLSILGGSSGGGSSF